MVMFHPTTLSPPMSPFSRTREPREPCSSRCKCSQRSVIWDNTWEPPRLNHTKNYTKSRQIRIVDLVFLGCLLFDVQGSEPLFQIPKNKRPTNRTTNPKIPRNRKGGALLLHFAGHLLGWHVVAKLHPRHGHGILQLEEPAQAGLVFDHRGAVQILDEK